MLCCLLLLLRLRLRLRAHSGGGGRDTTIRGQEGPPRLLAFLTRRCAAARARRCAAAGAAAAAAAARLGAAAIAAARRCRPANLDYFCRRAAAFRLIHLVDFLYHLRHLDTLALGKSVCKPDARFDVLSERRQVGIPRASPPPVHLPAAQTRKVRGSDADRRSSPLPNAFAQKPLHLVHQYCLQAAAALGGRASGGGGQGVVLLRARAEHLRPPPLRLRSAESNHDRYFRDAYY